MLGGRAAAAAPVLVAYDVAGTFVAGLCAGAAMLGRVVGNDRLASVSERIGRYGTPPIGPGGPVVWLHAASVGEVRAAEPLVAALRLRVNGLRLVVTCQTPTGLELAAGLGAEERGYLPIDCRFAVRRALRHFRPALFLFVEVEIWPRLLLELSAARVPAAMVGARVSEKSYRRYRRVRGLFAPSLATLACVCARDEDSLRRLLDLGAPSTKSLVCGDLKLDALAEETYGRGDDLLKERDHDAGLLFAVSTHEGEEDVVLAAFALVRQEHPSARLVIAPRHPHRAGYVHATAGRYGRTALWSRDRSARGWDVLVLDTTGEARGFFRAADCAFVGGSLVRVGGHNLAEPALFGVPFAVGPHLDAVRHQADVLDATGALNVVNDAEGLARLWSAWLRDPAEAARMGKAASDAVAANRGAVSRTVAALEPVLATLAAGMVE